MQNIITLDLEGVLIPEIWQMVAHQTNIQEFNLTTRDISDYDELMGIRIRALEKNNLSIHDIQEVISTLEPLKGAVEFLNTLRNQVEVIILSDTFLEFFQPIRKKLGFPTILCNSLNIDPHTHHIISHKMRMQDGKTHAVRALQSIHCKVAASGDSYNDLGMLQAADYAAWFQPPQQIIEEFPQFSVYNDYTELAKYLFSSLGIILES